LQILNLATSRRQTTRRLFEPFWNNLAFSVVKNLISKPQTTRTIAELLQLSVSELVLLLQQHALPWLVLTGRRDVIQKIAEFRGETEAWRPCLDNANMGSILALLLMQDVPQAQMESFVMTLLRNISPHFDDSSLVELLRSGTLQTVLELLKAVTDADEDKKSRVSIRNWDGTLLVRCQYVAGKTLLTNSHQISKALQTMAVVLAENRDVRRKKNIVASFLQQHALGITAWLAEAINSNTPNQPPVQEQRRCIRAMEETVALCGPSIRIARPQVSCPGAPPNSARHSR